MATGVIGHPGDRRSDNLFFCGMAVIILASVLGPMTSAQEETKGRKPSVEQLLMQMERDGNEATVKKDVATLRKLLADDWVGQSPGGTQTRAQALADLKSEDQKVDSITLGDIKCGSSETQLS